MIVGGPASFWALLVCYLVFLSLDVALALAFPWECVLFEAGILALFLPATLPLPELAATAAPAPALAWAYRILLFRVVFGFGKFKFIGATRKDLTYLQGFLINQPLPTKLAWHAHRLPLWVLRFGMVSLFWVEIPGALLTLVPGTLGLIGGAGIIGLMVVIHLSGNFGYFNVIVGFLCLPLLDFATPRALSLRDFQFRRPLAGDGFVAAHTLGALLYLPWNSYLSQSWRPLAVLAHISAAFAAGSARGRSRDRAIPVAALLRRFSAQDHGANPQRRGGGDQLRRRELARARVPARADPARTSAELHRTASCCAGIRR